MAIIIEDQLGDLSSNPGWAYCIWLITNKLGNCMNPALLFILMDK